DLEGNTIIKTLYTFEPSEMNFGQHMPLSLEVAANSPMFCEAVGARVLRGPSVGVRYRAVRCGGQKLQPIDEISWKQISRATQPGAIKPGVVLGPHRTEKEYIDRIKAKLGDGSLCASGEVSLVKKITLGLGWLKESGDLPATESVPASEPTPDPANEEEESEIVSFRDTDGSV